MYIYTWLTRKRVFLARLRSCVFKFFILSFLYTRLRNAAIISPLGAADISTLFFSTTVGVEHAIFLRKARDKLYCIILSDNHTLGKFACEPALRLHYGK